MIGDKRGAMSFEDAMAYTNQAHREQSARLVRAVGLLIRARAELASFNSVSSTREEITKFLEEK